MGYKVIYAPQAIERLKLIVSRIAQDNPAAAYRFGTRLLHHAELLSDFPEVGRRYYRRTGIRSLLCKPYFIFYRLSDEQKVVEVMDFWHNAQRAPKF